MNRCILCTRCVRFVTEVAGIPELGAIGRGEDMEIINYLEEALTSELQGNIVDLCPVGALTSKPYAFAARPWELNKTESIPNCSEQVTFSCPVPTETSPASRDGSRMHERYRLFEAPASYVRV
jgi:NADH dehydrogenase/NADH:ubiquinone oxidoreductase subunit G